VPARDMPAAQSTLSGSQVIEIVIGSVTVRVGAGIDATSLQAVLRAVLAVT